MSEIQKKNWSENKNIFFWISATVPPGTNIVYRDDPISTEQNRDAHILENENLNST